MKRSLMSLACAMTVAVVLASCTLAAPASAGAVSTHSHVDMAATDSRFGVDEAYRQADRADLLGARWSRIPFIWDYIQPSGPASWPWVAAF